MHTIVTIHSGIFFSGKQTCTAALMFGNNETS